MSFRENLQAEIKIERHLQKLVSTIREPPGTCWLDKVLTRELLEMTDFEHKKVRGLQLYIRPLEGEIMEVLLLDNELPVYHTTLADVALRKSPRWQEMFSIRNIKKILNHHDVSCDQGEGITKENPRKRPLRSWISLIPGMTWRCCWRMRAGAWNENPSDRYRNPWNYLFTCWVSSPCFLTSLNGILQVFAGPGHKEGHVSVFEHLILFDEETLSLGLKKGTFSPEKDMDLAWVMQYDRGERAADLKGIDVFKFLVELALKVNVRQLWPNKSHKDSKLDYLTT